MGLIKEPLEIDFFVDPRPLTNEEMLIISEFIKKDKQQKGRISKGTRTVHGDKTKKQLHTTGL